MTKVKIIPVVSYKIQLVQESHSDEEMKITACKDLGIFDKESEWEGFTKLSKGVKSIIVESPSPLFDMFGGLFQNTKDNERIANVISATEGLFPKTVEETQRKEYDH